MLLYVIRHGIAAETSPTGRDADRALTPEGIRRLERVAERLDELGMRPRSFVSSPLLRARETAIILRDRLAPKIEIPQLEELAPEGDPHAAARALRPFAVDSLALVGHLPSVQLLIRLFLGAAHDEAVEMKKGAVALIEFAGTPAPGRGCLRALMPPKILGATDG